MKFFISFLLMALLSFATCLYMPWWSIAIVCFIIAASIYQKPGTAFLCGLLALFALWAGMSWWISTQNEHLLAHKISELILKKDSPESLIAVTGAIGGLTGAFGALTGSLFRRMFAPKAV
jgi:hypothetical protein